jgi:hypothetical protein
MPPRRLLIAWLIMGLAIAAAQLLLRHAGGAELCWGSQCRTAAQCAPKTDHPSIPRVMIHDSHGSISVLTGCLVRASADGALVATAAHGFTSDSTKILVLIGAERYAGDLAHVDHVWDVALVAIPRPQPAWPFRLATRRPAAGETYHAGGYVRGRALQWNRGRLIGWASPPGDHPADVLVVAVRTSDGQSGGPIIAADGSLAGIISAGDGGETYGPASWRIAAAIEATNRTTEEGAAETAPVTREGADGIALDGGPAPDTEATGPVQMPLEPATSSTAEIPTRPAPPAFPPRPISPPAESNPREGADGIALDGGPAPDMEATGPVHSKPTGEPLAAQLAGLRNRLDQVAAYTRPVAAAVVSEAAVSTDPAPSLLTIALPAILAGLGWTGPPAVAAVVGVKILSAVIRRRRKREKGRAGDPACEFRGTVPRDDEEAAQFLQLSRLEGRSPLHDALVGRIAFDELDNAIDAEPGGPQADWARALKRTIERRFNEMVPVSLAGPALTPDP